MTLPRKLALCFCLFYTLCCFGSVCRADGKSEGTYQNLHYQKDFRSPYQIKVPQGLTLTPETGEGSSVEGGSYYSFTFGIGHPGRHQGDRYEHLDVTVVMVTGKPELEREGIEEYLETVRKSTSSEKFITSKVQNEFLDGIRFDFATYDRSDHRDNKQTFERGFAFFGMDGANKIFLQGHVGANKPVAADDPSLLSLMQAAKSFRRKGRSKN